MSAGGFLNRYVRSTAGCSKQTHSMGAEEARDMEEASKLDKAVAETAELRLVVATMLNVLVKKGTLDRNTLTEASQLIDQLDGNQDGRLYGKLLVNGKVDVRQAMARSELDLLSDAAK